MFSKELENLIEATLEDGILEDYEKAALAKRAQAEGVDLAELEIYINSILQRRKKEQKEKFDELDEKRQKEKKQALGRTCPNCGKQIPPMTLKCECGYEVPTNNHVSAVNVLIEKIEKIRSTPFKSATFLEKRKEANERDAQVRELITMFPVPNTKEDIVEFLSLAAPNSKKKGGFFGTIMGRLIVLCSIAIIITVILAFFTEGFIAGTVGMYAVIGAFAGAYLIDKDTLKWNANAKVWRAKFDQVMIKGRSLRGDQDFTQQLDYFESLVNK